MQQFENQWQMEAMASDHSGFDIWGFIRRRKSIVVVLAVFGAGLGYFLFQQQVPRYQSVARLELIHRSTVPFLQGVMGADMLEDASFVIPSPDVLTPAVRNHQLRELETLRGLTEEQAVARISGSLEVNQLSKGVIELRFSGSNRLDTPRITNAVADEYIVRQRESFESESDKLKSLLETDRINIERQLKAAEDKYDQFVRESVFLSSGGELNQPMSRMNAFNQQIASLDIEEAELVARVTVLDEKLREGGQREALMLLVGKAEAEPVLTRTPTKYEQAVKTQENERRRLSEALLPHVVEATILEQKVGPSHPRLVEVRKRIELVRREYTRMEKPLPKQTTPQAPVTMDYLAVYRQSLQHELEQLRSQRDDLKEMAAAAERNAHLVEKSNHMEMRLKTQVDRLQRQYDSIATKIDQTEVNADMSGVRAKVIRQAGTGFLVYPIIYRFVGLGGLMGALLGLVLGYVVELADRSFRKPEEVIREFGMPILGHIPYMKDKRLRGIQDEKAAKMDRTLVTAHLPRSRPAESYRTIRTAICFSTVGDGHRVVQVTSPAAGEGKSTLAANLAVTLAQSGKQTVLVESDFRRPSVHRLTGVSNEVGIVDVLRGNIELSDALQRMPVDDLTVLPCGRIPRNPSELLTRPEYEQLLEVLREKFDYVVVDTPPVLVVTDPCSVAPRADAVIVCMRLSRHTREFGRRAFGQLRDVGANVVGMVMNGVEESDAYGYGNYNYSESHGTYQDASFAYAYNFTDGHDEDDGSDDPEPAKRLTT